MRLNIVKRGARAIRAEVNRCEDCPFVSEGDLTCDFPYDPPRLAPLIIRKQGQKVLECCELHEVVLLIGGPKR